MMTLAPISGTAKSNYWSDWNSPDNDSNRIVDFPYFLGSGSGAVDYYPIAKVLPPVPETPLPMLLIILSLILIAAITVKLRKQ